MKHATTIKRAPFALVLSVALAASYASASAPVRADDGNGDGGVPPAVARISYVQGQVGVKHGDSGEQVQAAMNAPLIAGDYLSTGDGGRAEVQLDANTILRAGSNTQLRFTQLDGQADIAQLAAGSLELRVLQSDQDQVQVQTPSVDVEPAQPGAYLVTVTTDGNTEVTARSGSLTVVTPQGTQQVDPGRTMLVAGDAANPQYRYIGEVALTGVEQWGDQRDQQILASENGDSQYVGDVAGGGDLDQYGNWMDIPGYGNAWVPNDVAAGWTPYSNGTWVNEPYYGYTWVAAEPWGWAPYHYGRWCFARNVGWAWVPGPIYARPVWSPALVAFFGFGGGGTRFGLGFGNIGWVPLAPGEFYHPWWGAGNSLQLSVSFHAYRNYGYGFVGVPVSTWQHGVIRNVRPMSVAQLTGTRFHGGTVALRSSNFNTRFTSYRTVGTTFPRMQVQRFNAIHPIAMRTAPVSVWQRFGTSGRTFARTAPVRTAWQHFNTGGAQPNRGYAAQRYNPSQRYVQPAQRYYQPQQRYAQPAQRYYQPQQRYAQPAQRYYQPQQRYAQPAQRYYQPQQRYAQPAQRYYQPQQRYQPAPRYQAPQRSYQPQRSYHPVQRSTPPSHGSHPHGPGRS